MVGNSRSALAGELIMEFPDFVCQDSRLDGYNEAAGERYVVG
jgi:hypothetical protein